MSMSPENRRRYFLLVREVEFLLENADRELRQQVVQVPSVDRRLLTCESILRDSGLVATKETKALEARLTMLREKLDDYLEPIVEEVAQAWAKHMQEHPLGSWVPRVIKGGVN